MSESKRNDRVRNWCFTFFTVDKPLKDWPEHVQYAIWQLERCKSTERLHFQGYVEFSKKMTLFACKKVLVGAHWTACNGSRKDNENYCTKKDTYVDGPWSYGTPKNETQGNRNDLQGVIWDLQNDATLDDITLMHPEIDAKYHNWVVRTFEVCQKRKQSKLLHITPKPWQQKVIDLIKSDPDSRTINWYFDKIGNNGKSFLAKYLVDSYNAFYTRGGKANDITYAYNYENIVIFDYVRDAEEYVNYGVIEQLKDGLVTSNKYESKLKRCDPPHILVFANFLPDTSRMSADRWNIIYL